MVRILIYAIVFFVIYLVVKTFMRMKKAVDAAFNKEDKIKSPYKNIEEADYKEISRDPDNKSDKE
jgi:hypothetical protein